MTRHPILCFPFWSWIPEISPSVGGHSSDQVHTSGIDQRCLIGRHVARRWLVGNLELAALTVQIELLRSTRAGPSLVHSGVRRLKIAIVLILKQFVLHTDTVLAGDTRDMLILLQVLLDVCLEEFLAVHLT